MTTTMPSTLAPAAQTSSARISAAQTSSADIAALALAAVLGIGLILVAGFANSATIHDAAHDQRHAIAFPCH